LHGAPALGASVVDGGVAFALAAPNAQAVELCLLDAAGQTEVQRLQMPVAVNGVWQALLPGAGAGLVYGWRVYGPWNPAQGQRFNPHKLSEWVRTHGSVAGYPSGQVITREEFFATRCDLFIPAALEGQIGVAEAKALECRVIAEGANGPTMPEGEKVLQERGITVIPDVLANSGGVTVSYYEWVQNKRSESWDLEEVDARLETAMKRAYKEVSDFARTRDTDLRRAAYCVALERLQAAYRERDIFP
jgi:hypothetical protein